MSLTSLDLQVSSSLAAIYGVVAKHKIGMLSMTPVDLFSTMLENGGEEMRTAMTCDEYELGLPSLLALLPPTQR